MAILGTDGLLRLRREPPPAQVFTPSSISPSANGFRTSRDDLWTGDEVRLYSPFGIPISEDAVPDGTGVYVGGRWATGKNRDHITDDDDKFWLTSAETAPGPPDGDPVAGDGAWFYSVGDPITSGTFFVYVDQLGRITLYNTRRDAFYGDRRNRVQLFVLDFRFLTISPTGTEDYDNAVAACVDSLSGALPADVVDGQTLETICDNAPTYERPLANTADYQNADLQPRSRIDSQFPWEFICQMRSWTLETDGAAVDTTCLGTKWGENVKSLVTGGGTIDFMADRLYENDSSRDPTALMRLVLLTEKGAKADAEFFLISNRQAGRCDPRLPGDLFYETDLLVTNVAISVRPDDVVTGTARFVTTGPLYLREGPN